MNWKYLTMKRRSGGSEGSIMISSSPTWMVHRFSFNLMSPLVLERTEGGRNIRCLHVTVVDVHRNDVRPEPDDPDVILGGDGRHAHLRDVEQDDVCLGMAPLRLT